MGRWKVVPWYEKLAPGPEADPPLPTAWVAGGTGKTWGINAEKRRACTFLPAKIRDSEFCQQKIGGIQPTKTWFFLTLIRSSMNKNEKSPPHQDQKLVQKPSKTSRFQEPPGPTQHCTTVRGKSGGQSLAHPCTHLAYGSPERTWHILWTCLWWHTRYHCIEGRGMEWNGLLKIQGEEKRMMVRLFNHHFPR